MRGPRPPCVRGAPIQLGLRSPRCENDGTAPLAAAPVLNRVSRRSGESRREGTRSGQGRRRQLTPADAWGPRGEAGCKAPRSLHQKAWRFASASSGLSPRWSRAGRSAPGPAGSVTGVHSRRRWGLLHWQQRRRKREKKAKGNPRRLLFSPSYEVGPGWLPMSNRLTLGPACQ
jgi:hypothetical protein